ncbi:MAG: hypothetical protein ACYTF0_06405 [Planctomycetota bacterium]|jgi:hypothetical protein
MPPRSRRTRSSRAAQEEEAEAPAGRRPRRGSVAEEPSSADEAPVASGRSSRRASAAGRSGRGSSQRSSRRNILTPEQQAARKKAIVSTFVTIALIVILVGGGVVAYVALKPKQLEITVTVAGQEHPFVGDVAGIGNALVAQAQTALTAAESAFDRKDVDEATARLAEVGAWLDQEIIAHGNGSSDADPATVASPVTLAKAAELKATADELQSGLPLLTEQATVATNLARLKQQISKVTDPDTDVVALKAALEAFIADPVTMAGSAPDKQRMAYRSEISQVEAKLPSVEQERRSRLMQQTTNVEEFANAESQVFIERKQFGKALGLLDELATGNPDADFASVRSKILTAARLGWEADKGSAENFAADASAAGLNAEARGDKLNQAIAVLEVVVENYGQGDAAIEGYVAEAEQLLREYRSKFDN